VICEGEIKLHFTTSIQKRLFKQLQHHFGRHGTDLGSLRSFVARSKALEAVCADTNDITCTTLRQHLLLTEQILNLLLQLPIPKRIDSWIRNKKLHEFLKNNLKPIRGLPTPSPRLKIKVDQRLLNALEFATQSKWKEDKIALELGITLEETKRLMRFLKL